MAVYVRFAKDMITDASKTLFPYRRGIDISVRLNVDGNNDAYAYFVSEFIRDGTKWWHIIADNRIVMDVFKSTREEAEIALDAILIDRGYRLLTEEEDEKVRLLL